MMWYEKLGAELAVNVNVDVRLTDIDTYDVINNLYGVIEGGQVEVLGKHITEVRLVAMDYQTVKYSVGIVTAKLSNPLFFVVGVNLRHFARLVE